MDRLAGVPARHVPAKGEPSGPPVLLLHGAGFGAWMWERDQGVLAERGLTSWALALPGAPENEQAAPRLSIWATQAAEAAQALGPCVVMGHGAGALVAHMVASQVAVEGAILVSPVPPLNVRWVPELEVAGTLAGWSLAALLGRTVRFTDAEIAELGIVVREEGEGQGATDRIVGVAGSLARDLVVRPRLGPLSVPVLVTLGKRDRLVSNATSRLVCDFHNGMAWRFDDMGHTPPLEARGLRHATAVAGWARAPKRRKVFEVEAFSPTEGVGSAERARRMGFNPVRSDSPFRRGRREGEG